MTDAYLLADGWEWHYDTTAPAVLLRVVRTGGSTEVNIPDLLDGSTHLTTIGAGGTASGFNDAEGHVVTKILSMPASVTTISSYTFWTCSNLTSIVIGSGVTTIGINAFRGCTALTTINIPAGVTSIGGRAFSQDTALLAITVDASNANYSSVDGVLYDKAVTTLLACPGGKNRLTTIPSTVTTIDSWAFFGPSNIIGVVIPANVTTIGAYAFHSCTTLTSISFLGMTAPASVGADWIYNTPSGILGHAFTGSNFPSPGSAFNGLTMGVVNVAFTSSAVTSATAWEPYAYQVTASKTIATWFLTTSIPGIGISEAGYVYGITTHSGNSSVVITATDADGVSITQSYTLVISANSLGYPIKSFAAAGDGHLGNAQNPLGACQTALIASIQAMGINKLFDLGDLVDANATLADYQGIKANYDLSGITYYLASGNHDTPSILSTVLPCTEVQQTIVDGRIVWIVLPIVGESLQPIKDAMALYSGHLIFVLNHYGWKQIAWPAGESNSVELQQIIANNAHHMGGVVFAHAHKCGSYAGDGTYYTYAGTYGKIIYPSECPLGYTIFAVFQTSESEFTVKAWYHQIATESTLPGTYISYDATAPILATDSLSIADAGGMTKYFAAVADSITGGDSAVLTKDMAAVSESFIISDSSAIVKLFALVPESFIISDSSASVKLFALSDTIGISDVVSVTSPMYPYDFSAWFPHRVMISNRTSYGDRGTPVYSDPVLTYGYLTFKTHNILGPDGNIVESESSVLVAGDIIVAPYDKVMLTDGVEYVVKNVTSGDLPGGQRAIQVVYL